MHYHRRVRPTLAHGGLEVEMLPSGYTGTTVFRPAELTMCAAVELCTDPFYQKYPANISPPPQPCLHLQQGLFHPYTVTEYDAIRVLYAP